MGGWRDQPKILTRGEGGMEGIPPRAGTAMVPSKVNMLRTSDVGCPCRSQRVAIADNQRVLTGSIGRLPPRIDREALNKDQQGALNKDQ